MMTAYYTKGQLSAETTELAVKEFFKHHFGDFVDKHTEWALLYEPPSITPQILCTTRGSLNEIHRKVFFVNQPKKVDDKKNIMQQDLNQIVALLSEENPEGGKPKQGRRKKQKDPIESKKSKEPQPNNEDPSILGKRDKPEIVQQLKHHDEVSRQISALSDICYQPSDIYTPFNQVATLAAQNASSGRKTLSPLMPLTPQYANQGDNIINPNALMLSKIYKPSHTVSKYINSFINPYDPKNSQPGQYTQGQESPDKDVDMRKINASGILDRNMADHVNRMDS